MWTDVCGMCGQECANPCIYIAMKNGEAANQKKEDQENNLIIKEIKNELP